MKIIQPQVYGRNWGEEVVFALTTGYAGKLLRRRAGTSGGFQLHIKEETHYLLSGSLRLRAIEPDGTTIERVVTAGDCWTVPPGVVHQETAREDSVVIEASDPTQDDRYGIIPDPGGLPSMSDGAAVQKLRELAAGWQHRADDAIALAEHIERVGIGALIPPAFGVHAT